MKPVIVVNEKVRGIIGQMVQEHPHFPLMMLVALAADVILKEDGRISPEDALDMVEWQIVGILREVPDRAAEPGCHGGGG